MLKIMKRLFPLVMLLLLPLPAMPATVTVAEIHGAISPGSAAYFLRALDRARQADSHLLVLKLDTPGGLDSAMREMIQAILASPVPVATWVAPAGARAASAGTYLLYASHVAAMAPGTNLGAATPVAIGIGGEAGKPGADKPEAGKGSAMERKSMHDAAAYIRSLAQLRGRNAEWAERAVREAESLSAEEAHRQKVIDFVAADLPDLLRQAEGRKVKLAAGETTLALAGATVVTIQHTWKERLLTSIADPNIALILLMLGVYGLLFEFYTPGFGVAGIVGAICLLLALYALAMLPINAVGALLLLLGIALMATEAFVPSFGAFGIGGVAAFVAGALMLIDGDVPGLEISLAFVVPLAATSALLLFGIGTFALRARQRPSVAGVEAMIGATAVALEDIADEGWVRASGERWRARSAAPLRRGAQARITAVAGLTLEVEPQDKGGTS
ncbi:MAG: nodulation protein NfeD [Rhodocyclales bacterium]|nr:nodulation protein NfeD [Rhodocyclales bacterium]